jgi:thiol-disulfide isomerase/thioredoxin
MTRAGWASVWLTVGLAVTGLCPGGEPPKAAPSGKEKPAGAIAARFAAIRDEYDAARTAASKASDKGKTEFESWKIYSKLMPDESAFSKRMVDLAATDPKDTAARDALLWVLDKPGMGGAGPYADEYMRAVLMLLRHHADDPEVARLGLQIDNIGTVGRDVFLEGLYVQAKGREAKGLARVALAQYLMTKLHYAEAGRNAAGRPLTDKIHIQTYDDTGKLAEREIAVPPEEKAYQLHARQYDPEAIRAQARQLFEEVIKDYGDIPHVTRRTKALEELLKQPNPTWNGEPIKPEDRKAAERRLARKQTLADVAKAKLDEMDNLVAGKPAPPIDGVGMDGKPLKLSDYRGKVVVLVFWGTWCGPCMREVPHEREMAETYKGKPFAMLGIDCDGDKAAALKVMAKEKITWPNWNDGEPGEGPIVKAYHVRGFPTTYVIDPKGTIRHIGPTGSALDKAVDGLLAEMAANGPGK